MILCIYSQIIAENGKYASRKKTILSGAINRAINNNLPYQRIVGRGLAPAAFYYSDIVTNGGGKPPPYGIILKR